jgi:hypothetical protein
VQPTATDPPLDATAATAPSGLWTITVAATAAVTIEAWIGRKIDPGHRRGVARQSYFDDPDYRRVRPNTRPVDFDLTFNRSYARRTGTLSGIATGEHTRVVGACVRSSFAPADYSSMGPVSGGPRVKPSPSLLAVAEDTGVLHGVLAAGTRSGSIVAMNGSSVAAPQLTRAVAESLATSTVPVLAPPPAGTPAAVVGDSVLVYPSGWYRTWRPDRPTY